MLADGTIEGFVGGDCAEATVRAQALAMLDSGESVLLRISPTPEPPVSGRLMAHNPCLSGGTLEIFLEPQRPASLIAVVGDSPIARALVTVGEALGYEAVRGDDVPDGASAVIVASHGRDEATPLVAALRRRRRVRRSRRQSQARRRGGRRVSTSIGARGADRHPGRARHRRPHRRGGRPVDPRRHRGPPAAAIRARCRRGGTDEHDDDRPGVWDDRRRRRHVIAPRSRRRPAPLLWVGLPPARSPTTRTRYVR